MENRVEQFIDRWQGKDGTERANYQIFLTELCELLGLAKPDPASSDTEQNTYVFERRVDIKRPDGSESRGYIDLYKRGCFVLEAKQTSQDITSERWDKSMLRAQAQGDTYIRALPSEEGRPPFLIVTDVGRSIELYSEFSRSGATYVPYPDPRSHRIKIEDLREEAIRQRLAKVWNDPLTLDPSKQSARVTRDIAAQLAELAKSLEGKYSAEEVASFLMRCLFTMFAEDVGLIPHNSFTELLESLQETPDHLVPMLEGLWDTMNSGGFSPHIRQELLKFNGGLFAEGAVLPLDKAQIQLLIQAAHSDWRYVEPAIFGTLLERALNPTERHKLGAHYTPRSYVERLVLPTIMEPLREEWGDVQAVAAALEHQDKHDKAVNEVRNYHIKLCGLRILDPACGSGNFLYVTLEHMKRLEGEILNFLEGMGESQSLLEMDGVTVDPHQFLGLEINPRAAKIAEMVLWIGYLQWHFRTQGKIQPPEPVLRDFHNIECCDAVLAYDVVEDAVDVEGNVITQWDGKTKKIHPITGLDVPDETARVPHEHYKNPRKASWPEVDFIIGNPPFIGNKRMRDVLGGGYAGALREAYPRVPNSADFVMYWWHHAADLAREQKIQRFGFITTNSLRQTFNRRVVQHHLDDKKPMSLMFAIPDHPWVDSSDGAAVRIAMTVGEAGDKPGVLSTLAFEQNSKDESLDVLTEFETNKGKIFPDLKIGANVTRAAVLEANHTLANVGVQLSGKGFILSGEEAASLLRSDIPNLSHYIKPYVNGRDINQIRRGVYVIDLFGLSVEKVRNDFSELYQIVLTRVKPDRDNNNRKSYRENWWIFAEPRKSFRTTVAGLNKYIATTRTSRHRIFTFLDGDTVPDAKVVWIAMDDDFWLGILSSRLHTMWSNVTGANLGVGNDTNYNHSDCFDKFPFPIAADACKKKICVLAKQLDFHRKHQQELYPNLTLTNMYNVLEKLRTGEDLTEKERDIHEQGLVSVLKEIHDDLDRAVFNAYGWDDLAEILVGLPGATTPLPDKSEAQAEVEEELLKRLVDLNAQRAAEEAKGHIRWLRPEYQAPERVPTQTEMVATTEATIEEKSIVTAKLAWPKELQQQIKVVREHLASTPMTTEVLAAQFKRKPIKGVSQVLNALFDLGMVTKEESGVYSSSY